tara:strand:- start:822 stop:1073 length:252 start_codon:yes stop_codon:yes gene_type:complete
MFSKLLGDPNTRKLKRYYPIVSDVNIFEEDLVGLSDDQLRSRTSEFRTRLAKLPTPEKQLSCLDELLPEAFATLEKLQKEFWG